MAKTNTSLRRQGRWTEFNERTVLLVLACALVVLVGILLFQENKQTTQLVDPTNTERSKE